MISHYLFLFCSLSIIISPALLHASINLNPQLERGILVEKKSKEGEILVRFDRTNGKDKILSIHKQIGAKVVSEYQFIEGLQLVRLSNKEGVEGALHKYRKYPGVLYAEPNYIYHVAAAPNDAQFGNQWALKNDGQNLGSVGADINILDGWNIVEGSKDYVVGVIDTGILHSHPDLVDNMWRNTGEIPDNGIDDDLNGYIDDVYGINAITKTGDPKDDHGHGTHVAGTIGAAGNNGIGISGVNQKTSMIGCKFLDARGSGSASDAITCLNYFAELATRPVDPVRIVVTNNSWGGGGYSQALFDAIKAHEDIGILFVAAAANDSRDNNNTEAYPANYQLSNVISVAATDNKDELASFSNYGSKTVHVAAPGAKILSTYLGNNYKELSGTSMAAPHVAGLVSLLRAAKPDLNFIQTRNLIITSGTPIPSVANKTISGRRITAASDRGLGALTCFDQSVRKRILPKESAYTIPVGESLDMAVLSLNCESAVPVSFLLGEYGALDLSDDGVGGDHLAEDGVFSTRFSPSTSGSFSFDFGGGDVVAVNVFDPSSWHEYVAKTDERFEHRVITGTNLRLGDDSVKTIDLPFSIKFGGDLGGFSKIHIGSNGVLSFTGSNISSYQNVELPYQSVDTLVAPYWDDLAPGADGGVYYGVINNAPNREFIVEWRKVKLYGGSKTGTLQVVFFENSSDILFNYLDVGFGSEAFGKSATIGVQSSKARFSQYSFNEAKLKNNLAIRFTRD